MPIFRVETNLPACKIPGDFAKNAVPLVAKTLGKPESYCVVTIVPDVHMNWGGSDKPCALASLISIGKLGVAENKKHSAVLLKYLQDTLGILADRMYIEFRDYNAAFIGHNNTTFHDILGGS